jgi:hypothetical protein
MTKLVVMSDHSWIALKIRSLIFSESEILRKAIRNIRDKICNFEKNTEHPTRNPSSDRRMIWRFWNGKARLRQKKNCRQR